MKKNNVALMSLLVAGILVFLSGITLAALWGKTLEGSVARTDQGMLTISQQAADGSIEEISIQLNDQTRYEEIASANELAEGDQVKIEYKEDQGQKVATKVMKIGFEQEQPVIQ